MQPDLRAARALLPPGFVIVPVEAHEAMLDAGFHASPVFQLHRPASWMELLAPVKAAYAAMVKAADVCPGCGGDTEIDGVKEYCECKGTGHASVTG